MSRKHEAIRLRGANMTYREIAAVMGVTYQRVEQLLRGTVGQHAKAGQWRQAAERRDAIDKLTKAGYNARTIAAQLGCHPDTVRRLRREKGSNAEK